MVEGTTCYERDEVLCEDQMCLRTGCKLRNERLLHPYPDTTDAEWIASVIRGVIYGAPMAGGFQDDKIMRAARAIVAKLTPQPVSVAQQKRTPFPEPPLTCPAIDAFISKHSPEDEIVKELTAIRDINSQLRFGLWSEQSRADEAEANLDSRSEIIEECARMADGWLAAHGQNEIKYTSARDYACDAVADVADAIRGLAIPSTSRASHTVPSDCAQAQSDGASRVTSTEGKSL